MQATATSHSLLLQLRDIDDQQAWSEFVRRYGPRIYAWCKRCELQDSDASDVTQDVLAKLVRAMRTFEYDAGQGTFRGWLKTVTKNAVRDFQRSRRPDRGSGDSQIRDCLLSIQTPDALSELITVIEQESERELLREAEFRVQLRVQDATWQAYEHTVKLGEKPAAVADQLDLAVADVYRSKSRVLKMLKREVHLISQHG